MATTVVGTNKEFICLINDLVKARSDEEDAMRRKLIAEADEKDAVSRKISANDRIVELMGRVKMLSVGGYIITRVIVKEDIDLA